MHCIEVKLIEPLMDYKKYTQNSYESNMFWGLNNSVAKFITTNDIKSVLEQAIFYMNAKLLHGYKNKTYHIYKHICYFFLQCTNTGKWYLIRNVNLYFVKNTFSSFRVKTLWYYVATY